MPLSQSCHVRRATAISSAASACVWPAAMREALGSTGASGAEGRLRALYR